VSQGSHPAPGGRRASRYRFRHILFQEYLYGGLDEAERAYLHEAVGNGLEQLYAGQERTIAIQLARHYHAAARIDKAADYYLQAGHQARALYAQAEARQHYAHALAALAQLPDTEKNRRRRVDALILHSISSWHADSPEHLLARLIEAEQLVQELPDPEGTPGGDRLRLVRIRVWMWRARYLLGEFRECIRYCQQALPVAKEAGDRELLATLSSLIGMARLLQGRFGEAEALLRQVIPLVEQMGNWSEWFRALVFHGLVLAVTGDYARGLAEIQRAHASAQEVNALTEIAQGYGVLATAYVHAGDLPRAMAAARQAVETAGQSGDRSLVYLGHMHQSWAADRAGQYSVAAASMTTVQAVRKELGNPLIHAHFVAAVNAEIALGAGRVQEALCLAQHAVGVAQDMDTIFTEGLARRAWGRALAALVPPRWKEAEAQLTQSLRLMEAGQSRLEAARTHVAWGTVCRDRGDLAAARTHWEQAAAQWETSGLTHELECTRALIAGLALT
jgi:tetratricopeptide (TPR) repeat protein